MFNPSIYQRVKHKIIKKIEKYYAPLKQQQLNDTNITIISNNCWGGVAYEGYDIKNKVLQ